MNYKQKAREIREQRFAMWNDIGRPSPVILTVKGRQCGYTPPMSMLRYTPWSDQWISVLALDWAQRMWIARYGDKRKMTLGLLDATRNY